MSALFLVRSRGEHVGTSEAQAVPPEPLAPEVWHAPPTGPADPDAVFRAVSDPTRRAILELLRLEERTAGDLAAPFAMSRPAISQHLKVLKDAELVSVRSEGRARVYGLNPLPLHALFDWSTLFEGALRRSR